MNDNVVPGRNNQNQHNESDDSRRGRHVHTCSMRPRSGKEYISVELKCNFSRDQNQPCLENDSAADNLTNDSSQQNNLERSSCSNGNKPLNLSSFYNKERKIAYAAMTRVGDGSIKLDDDNSSLVNQFDIKEQRCLSPPALYSKLPLKNKSLSSISSSSEGNFVAPRNQTNVNYITLDFETSASQSNVIKNTNVKFDSKVDYACIDFAKMKAIKEASEEHFKDKGLASLSADSSSVTDLDQNVFFCNSSTNFYVPISPELLNFVSSDRNQVDNVASDKMKCKTFEKQRKSSLDLLDFKSTLPHYSNTLPHNPKRNIE